MATNQLSGFIQRLRIVLRDGAGLSDGQLLADYLGRRDEAAVAALVRRHGPMVWGVCRRILRNHHDAEDAFQTTFLVLIRKAASIASRELLANWLYGVAHQTALKARATAAKRKGRERQVTDMPEPAVTQQDQWRDLQPVLDEELSRLPAKYRGVILLCDLEGKTRKEAAGQLRCLEGTVAGRLARARIMLAKRLTRRGVAFSGGALAAVLTQQVASASAPASVVVSTIKAASLIAAGKAAAAGAISAKVAALTEGVMKAMLLTKLKTVLAVVLVLGFAAAGATVLTCRTAAGQEDKPPVTEKPVKASAEEQDKEGFTAWGKEAGGLQAGLGYLPGQHRTYHIGETVTLAVRVRNVSKEAVEFQYIPKFFVENAPTVTDGKGKQVHFPYGFIELTEGHSKVDVSLAPGKEIKLGEVKLLTTSLGSGKFTLQYDPVFQNTWGAKITLDPTLTKLATGKLDLEIKPEPPPADDKADKGGARTSLSDAIKALNVKASHDPIGKDETPITEPEIIAAIRAAQRPEDSDVTDKLFDAFKKIAQTKQLPPGAELEAVGGPWDPGGSFVYDVWWVRLRMPKEANGTYGFVIRERFIRSRTLQEEMARLEKELPAEGERLVDGGRLEARIDALKKRIEKMKAK